MAQIQLSPKQVHKIAACILYAEKLHDTTINAWIKLEAPVQGDVEIKYEADGIPYTAVIDKQGRITRAE